MRIGLCANMIATGADGTGAEYVEKLAQIGFDYVELPLAEMTALPEAEFVTLGKRVAASGIRCEACNNFFPKTLRLTGPDIEEAGIMAYVEKALDRAGALGAEYVVFGSGPAKNVPAGFALEAGRKQVAALLRQVAPVARRHGIGIVIEPLRKEECNIVNTFQEGCLLAESVAAENVNVLVDFYHLSQEREPLQNLLDGGRYLRHVHFARNEGRSFPSDGPDDASALFFSALKTLGYNGRISLEAYTQDFESQALAALAFLRQHT